MKFFKKKIKFFKNRILPIIGEWIILGILWLIYLTCRKSFNTNKLPPYPCELLFWHNRLAMLCFSYEKYYKGRNGKVITSLHWCGEITTRIISHFGISAIRGSSYKKAMTTLRNCLKAVDDGFDIILTPDGPKGPLHSISDGAVVIAQKKDLEIYVMTYEASRFWEFKTWDRMRLPKPFSEIRFALSKGFKVNGLNINQAKEKIRQELFKLEQETKN